MKIISIIILTCITFFSTVTIASDDLTIRFCEGCDENQMSNQASAISTSKRRTIVHVVDPINNKVEAYTVIKVSEPGFQSTDTYKAIPSQEVIDATSIAHEILKNTRSQNLSQADRIIAEEIFDLYPGQIPNHVRVFKIDPNIMSSAKLIEDVGYKAILSKTIEEHLGLNIMSTVAKTVVGAIMSQYKSFAVIVFDDNSMLVATLARSHSSFRWDAVFYVDSNGVPRDQNGKLLGSNSFTTGAGGVLDGSGTWTVVGKNNGVEWCFVNSKGEVESCWFETSPH